MRKTGIQGRYNKLKNNLDMFFKFNTNKNDKTVKLILYLNIFNKILMKKRPRE